MIQPYMQNGLHMSLVDPYNQVYTLLFPSLSVILPIYFNFHLHIDGLDYSGNNFACLHNQKNHKKALMVIYVAHCLNNHNAKVGH